MTIEQLVKALESGDQAARLAATETLAGMDPASIGAAAPALAQAAGAPELCEASAALLEEMGAPPADCLPRLSELLSADAADTAYWAATLLGRAGANATNATADLETLAAKGNHLAARERAAWALGKIGPPAANAAPTLAKLAESEHARLARLAKQALSSVNGG